jgi:serine/threonine-protein kinase
MLTGRLPQPGQYAGDFNPDLDENWNGFFEKALAEEPGGRFASARAMKAELDDLFAEWRSHMERACSLADIQPPGKRSGPEAGELRSKPVQADPERAREEFGLDELWRPRVYCACSFADRGDGAVADQANGLLWERSGSPYPLNMDEARDYLDYLNREALGGCDSWRLPTVAEVKLLLTPVRHREDHCMDPVFDTTQTRVWTADRAGRGEAWFADADLGFIAEQDDACRMYVRAVCGMRK